jgi:hypothetical protein
MGGLMECLPRGKYVTHDAALVHAAERVRAVQRAYRNLVAAIVRGQKKYTDEPITDEAWNAVLDHIIDLVSGISLDNEEHTL